MWCGVEHCLTEYYGLPLSPGRAECRQHSEPHFLPVRTYLYTLSLAYDNPSSKHNLHKTSRYKDDECEERGLSFYRCRHSIGRTFWRLAVLVNDRVRVLREDGLVTPSINLACPGILEGTERSLTGLVA